MFTNLAKVHEFKNIHGFANNWWIQQNWEFENNHGFKKNMICSWIQKTSHKFKIIHEFENSQELRKKKKENRLPVRKGRIKGRKPSQTWQN